MYKRPYYQALKSRVEEPRKHIQVISGPRQVGKTTMVKQFLNEYNFPYKYVSADNISSPGGIWIEQQWESARIIRKQESAKEFLLIIDEIQKIPGWSNYVKAEWDKDSFNDDPVKVVLLGSSNILIQKGLTESLAGRFEKIHLPHWSFKEMAETFNYTPEQYAWFGGYPGSADLIKDEERWKSYVKDALIEPSILKDILMLTRIDKPALLKRLFELACFYSGQILSFSKLLGQLQDAGNTTTLSHYLSILNQAELVAGIEKFYKEKVRQRGSSPKFIVHNPALMTVQKNISFNDAVINPEIWGRHIETVIGSHLLNFACQENYQVYYWRERNDEIDFVLEKGNQVIGIEIKSGNNEKTKGMYSFKKKFDPLKTLLVGKTGITWQEFLMINPGKLF